jgi:hypothetical protein
MRRNKLLRVARKALEGVGDPRFEWLEWTGHAFHLRRRLTIAEELVIGPALDLRGTVEAQRRLELARPDLPPAALRLAAEELRPRIIGSKA